jgi:hypothetical protein
VTSALDVVQSALEVGDPAPILAILAEESELHSPALIGPRYRGRDLVGSIITAAMQVLEDVRVSDRLHASQGATAGVVFDARVGELPAQGLILLRATATQISEITLFLRPLPALRAFVSHMGELGAQPALDAGER